VVSRHFNDLDAILESDAVDGARSRHRSAID
jgi:hypothetical protein